MKIVRTDLPKLCHSKPGDVVALVNESGVVQEDLFIVTVVCERGKRAGRIGLSPGLYDDERPLFLVNLATGEARVMPHLSERICPVAAYLTV